MSEAKSQAVVIPAWMDRAVGELARRDGLSVEDVIARLTGAAVAACGAGRGCPAGGRAACGLPASGAGAGEKFFRNRRQKLGENGGVGV